VADDKTFDPNPLFDYLPSIYRDFYANRPELTAIYEAWIRAQDSDYAKLFQLDAARDLSTVPVQTFYPLVFQELGNWQSLQVPHAHWQTFQDWPVADQTINADSSVTELYRVRIPDHALKGRVQVLLDGRAVPTYVYTCSLEPWVDSGELVQGTTLVFDASVDANGNPVGKFAKFLAGEFVGSASSNVNNSGNLGAGAPGEQPQQSTENTSQEWTPAAEIERISVYAFRDQQIVQGLSNGTTTSYTPQVDGTAITYDPVDAQLFLESFNALSLLDIDYSDPTAPIITQKPLGGIGAGNLLQLRLSDDTLLFKELPAAGQTLTLSVTSGVTVVAADVRVGFRLGAEFVNVTATELSLLGGNSFHGGARVRIKDARGVQTVEVSKPTRKIQLERTVDPDQVEVLYLGTNILNPSLTATTLGFDRAPNNGVTFKLVAPIVEAHSHASYREVLDEATDTVAVPITRPFALDAADEPKEQFPIQVFVDDTEFDYDSTLVEPASYTFTDSRTIQFAEVLPVGAIVDIYYVDQETQDNHRHIFGEITIPPTILEQFTVKLDDSFDRDKYPVQIFRDGFVFTDPEEFTIVSDQFVQFDNALTPGLTVTINAAIDSKAYLHSLPVRVDIDYGYRGQITNVAIIRDGVTQWDTELNGPAGDFDLVVQEDETLLYADVRLEEGWFFETDVDEQTIAQVWGEPIDLVRDSSAEYRGLTASLYAAYRGASTKSAIQNYGSILLGSAFLDQAGTAAGIVDTTTGQGLTVQPSDGTATFVVPLLPEQPLRVLRAPQEMSKFYAVNDLVTVYDRDELADVGLLAFFAEQFSDDYQFAKRLDVRTPSNFTSTVATFNNATGLLTDFSVNFFEQEVWAGDLIKLGITSFATLEQAQQSAFLPTNTGAVDVTHLSYDSTVTAGFPAGSLSITTASVPPFVIENLLDSPSGFSTLLGLVNAPLAWQNELDEAFAVDNSSPTGSGSLITCVWPTGKAAPSSPDLSPVVGAVQVQEVAAQSYLTLPSSAAATQYGRVVEVVDAHTLRVTFDSETIGAFPIGYGDGQYGQYGYGGGILAPSVTEYTVWARQTRTLDQFLYLDEALDPTQAQAVGENIQLLNTQLANVFKHHVFAVKLRWGLATEQAQLEDVAVFLDRIRPAETQPIVFTEAFEDEVADNSALADTTTATLVEGSPSLSLQSDNPLANTLLAGESFIAQAEFNDQTDSDGWLYTPYLYSFGPEVASQLTEPPATLAPGVHYLVGDDQFLNQSSVFARRYSEKRGLGNLAVRYESPSNYWIADSGQGYRTGKAIELTGDRRLQVANTGVTNALLPAANTLDYSSGSEFAFRTWLKINSGSYVGGETPVIFSYGPITLGLNVLEEGVVRPYFEVGASGLFVSPDPGSPGSYVFPNPFFSPNDPEYSPEEPDPFGDGTAIITPASTTYTLPVNEWFEITAQYRDLGNRYRTEIVVNGELWGVGSPSPDTPVADLTVNDVTGEDLWIGGVASGSPVFSVGGAIQQPSITLTNAFNPEALETSFSIPRPIHNIGVEATTGSPLVTDGLTAVYHFWRGWGLTIPDYSGNGFSATKVGSGLTEDWRVDGIVQDLWPREYDVHTVDREGIVLLQGAKVAIGDINDAVVFNEDFDIEGPGAETEITGQFIAGAVTYVAPDYWLTYSGLKGWQRLNGGAKAVEASIDLDNSDHYDGFLQPTDPDPDGVSHSTLASDQTLVGARATLTFEAEFGGAISDLTWDGVNVLNSLTKARGAQYGFSGVDRTGSYLVNEGGNLLQVYTQPSDTPLVFSQFGEKAARTDVYMPYLVPFSYQGASLTISAARVDKHVEVDYLGNPSIIRVRGTITPELTNRDGSARSQLSMALTDEFVRAYTYFPVVGDDGPTEVGFSAANQLVFPSDLPGGMILSNQTGTRAVGICALDKVISSSVRSTLILPPLGQLNPVGQKYGQFNALLLMQELLADGVSTAGYTVERFICVGSFAEVAVAFSQLVTGESVIIDPPDPPPISLSVDQQPQSSLNENQTFTVAVSVQTNEGTIDADYEDSGVPIVAQLAPTSFDGVLSGTTSKLTTGGLAIFDDLRIDEGGAYEVRFTSGVLTEDSAAITVNNPVPTLLSITPSTGSTASPPSSISLFGSGFDESARVIVNGTTPIPGTYQSPTLFIASPDPALLSTAGTYVFSILNFAPGGGQSGGVAYISVSPSSASPSPATSPLAADTLESDLTALVVLPEVGNNQGFRITSQLIDSDFEGQAVLDSQATGSITLSIASTTSNGGTFESGSEVFKSTTNGVITQDVGFTRAGLYTLEATWAGSPSLSPNETVTITTQASVVNPPPTIESLSPSKILQFSGDTTVRINAASTTTFFDGEVAVFANGSVPLPTTFVDPGTITFVAPSFALQNLVNYKIAVFTGQYASNELDLTVVPFGVPEGPFPEEDDIPATIRVTPTGWQRLLPEPDATETASTEPLAAALRQVGVLNGADGLADGTPVFLQESGSKGALDVIEIDAGAYGAISFTDSNGPGEVQLLHTPTATEPLIIRATPGATEPEPVVIDPGADASIFFDYQTANQHVHFYDLKIRAGESAAIKTPGKVSVLKLKDSNVNTNDNPLKIDQGTSSTKWQGLEFHRCAVLGEWDHALVRLAPNRWIRGPLGADQDAQDQYDDQGNTVAPANKIAWTKDEVDDAVAFDVSLLPMSRTRPNAFVFGFAPPTATAGVSNVNDPKYYVNNSLYTAPDEVFWSGYGDPDPDTYDNAPGNPLRRTATVRYIGGGGFGSTGVINFLTSAGNQQLTFGNTITLPVGGGMLLARITSASVAAIYNLDVVFDDPQLPDGRARRLLNLEFRDGVTYPVATQAVLVAKHSDVWVFPRDAAYNTAFGANRLSTEVFSTVIKFTDDDGVVDLDSSTIGTVSITVADSTPLVAGNQWEVIAATPGEDPAAWTVRGGLLATQLRLEVTADSIAAVTSAFSGKFGAPITLRFTPSNPAINPVDVPFYIYAYGGPESFPTQSFNDGIYPGAATEADVYYPNYSHATVLNAVVGNTQDGEDFFEVDDNRPPLRVGSGDQPGGPFFPGWPGDPSHPNYDETVADLYPDPSNVPNLVYGGGRESLWGVTARNVWDFVWSGGSVVNIAQRHGIELRNVGGDETLVEFSTIRLCGRSGVRVLSRLTGNQFGPPDRDLLTAPGTISSDTGGPSWGTLLITDNVIRDTGLSHAESAVDISGHQYGQVRIENNNIRLGYNLNLSHLRYMCGNGVDVNDGPQFTFRNNTAYYEHWPVYLTDRDGVPLISYQDIVEGVMAFGPTDPSAPLPTEFQNLINTWPVLPGSDVHPVTGGSQTFYPPVFDGTFAPELVGSTAYGVFDIRGGNQQVGNLNIEGNIIRINDIENLAPTSGVANGTGAWSVDVPARNRSFAAVSNPGVGEAVGSSGDRVRADLLYRYRSTWPFIDPRFSLTALMVAGCRVARIVGNTLASSSQLVELDPVRLDANINGSGDVAKEEYLSSRIYLLIAADNVFEAVTSGAYTSNLLSGLVDYGVPSADDTLTSLEITAAFQDSNFNTIGPGDTTVGLLIINMPATYSGSILVRGTIPLPAGLKYSDTSPLKIKHPVTGEALTTQWEPVSYYPDGEMMAVVELMAMVDPTGIPVNSDNQATFEVVATVAG